MNSAQAYLLECFDEINKGKEIKEIVIDKEVFKELPIKTIIFKNPQKTLSKMGEHHERLKRVIENQNIEAVI